MIPKIIHQIGPIDRRKWHPVWNQCHKTWLEIYQDCQIFFWDDEESISNFIKEKYPEKYEFYNSLPLHIMKLDYVRYAILNYYGGIYADLDVYCYENIFEDLTNKICLIEPINFPDNPIQTIMTCLMASEPNQQFWNECMSLSESRYKNIDKSFFLDKNVYDLFDQILDITGPKLVIDVFEKYQDKDSISFLKKEYFHPSPCDYFEGIKTKHMKTTLWGKDAISICENIFNMRNLNYTDGMIVMYNTTKGIDLNQYEYKKHYV